MMKKSLTDILIWKVLAALFLLLMSAIITLTFIIGLKIGHNHSNWNCYSEGLQDGIEWTKIDRVNYEFLEEEKDSL